MTTRQKAVFRYLLSCLIAACETENEDIIVEEVQELEYWVEDLIGEEQNKAIEPFLITNKKNDYGKN